MKSVKKSFNLKDKVVVITGGAGLMGEKHAQAIAEFGGIAILLDIDEKVGAKKAKEISKEYDGCCKFMFCDITDELQILQIRDFLLNEFGHIDVLINNAAIDPKVVENDDTNLSRLENFTIEQWNLELSVGLTGALLCSKIFGSAMAKMGKGVILNISSDLGIIAPDQRIYKKEGLPENLQPVKPVTYSVIKHGLIGLTKYIATYWNDQGIRCNALCPGGIFTNQESSFVKKLTNLIPLNRMAEPDEYQGALIFLLSDASKYMNGAVISIDGGRSVW